MSSAADHKRKSRRRRQGKTTAPVDSGRARLDAAARMRAYRARQREGREAIVIGARTAFIEDLVEDGLLRPNDRDRKKAISAAVERWIDLARYVVTTSRRPRV